MVSAAADAAAAARIAVRLLLAVLLTGVVTDLRRSLVRGARHVDVAARVAAMIVAEGGGRAWRHPTGRSVAGAQRTRTAAVHLNRAAAAGARVSGLTVRRVRR